MHSMLTNRDAPIITAKIVYHMYMKLLLSYVQLFNYQGQLL